MKSKKKNKYTLFVIPVIIIICLLVVQALCDLKLPNYTSDIINNGIQQNGIESAIPSVLPKKSYELILRLSTNKELLENSYEVVAKTEENIKKFPLLNTEELYQLKNLEEQDIEALEKEIVRPIVILNILKNTKQEEMGFFSQINIIDYLLKADDQTFNTFISTFTKKIEQMDEYMLKQYGVEATKTIYKEVGLDLDKTQIHYIISKGLDMLKIAAIGMIAAIFTGFLISRLASQISYVLREKVVKKIMNFSVAECKDFGASSLITRATNDVEQVKTFCVMLLRIVIFAPIMGIGAYLKVADNPLNWLIAVALAVIVILIIVLFTLGMPKFKRIQKLIDKMNLVSREIITGMPVIRTFSTQKYEEKRFDKANHDLTKINLFVNRLMGIMMPSMMLVMNIISILIVWFGAKQIDIGTLQVGSLLAFITYTMQIIMSFLMISAISVILPRALVSIRRIKEILKKEISIKEPTNPKKFDASKKGIVEFKNVTFAYPDSDEAMLKNINFIATPGTTTAFIGSTGSGKSTLINLIPRFFDTTSGTIYIDGVNVKEASIKDLRNRIGYVPQKGILFSGTVESNLKFGNDDLSPSEMKEVAKVSQALDFIEEKKDQFHSEISQGGTNVSGGQKQRLAIARAIAKKPEIYIFDDSFSALDFKTDALLRKALNNYAKDATVLIVAQRISTIMNADNIIVLNEGEIVGSGTHKELLKSCPIYKEIALSQLKEDEL